MSVFHSPDGMMKVRSDDDPPRATAVLKGFL